MASSPSNVAVLRVEVDGSDSDPRVATALAPGPIPDTGHTNHSQHGAEGELSQVPSESSAHMPFCWGAQLKGDASNCLLAFDGVSNHFKNKFCKNCLRGLVLPAANVRVLSPEIELEFTNKRSAGFWKSATTSGHTKEVEYRIVNNTLDCNGPRLIVFRHAPIPLLAWPEMRADWVVGESVPVHVARGTLVPASTLRLSNAPTAQRPAQKQAPRTSKLRHEQAWSGRPDSYGALSSRGPSSCGAWEQPRSKAARLSSTAAAPLSSMHSGDAYLHDMPYMAEVVDGRLGCGGGFDHYVGASAPSDSGGAFMGAIPQPGVGTPPIATALPISGFASLGGPPNQGAPGMSIGGMHGGMHGGGYDGIHGGGYGGGYGFDQLTTQLVGAHSQVGGLLHGILASHVHELNPMQRRVVEMQLCASQTAVSAVRMACQDEAPQIDYNLAAEYTHVPPKYNHVPPEYNHAPPEYKHAPAIGGGGPAAVPSLAGVGGAPAHGAVAPQHMSHGGPLMMAPSGRRLGSSGSLGNGGLGSDSLGNGGLGSGSLGGLAPASNGAVGAFSQRVSQHGGGVSPHGGGVSQHGHSAFHAQHALPVVTGMPVRGGKLPLSCGPAGPPSGPPSPPEADGEHNDTDCGIPPGGAASAALLDAKLDAKLDQLEAKLDERAIVLPHENVSAAGGRTAMHGAAGVVTILAVALSSSLLAIGLSLCADARLLGTGLVSFLVLCALIDPAYSCMPPTQAKVLGSGCLVLATLTTAHQAARTALLAPTNARSLPAEGTPYVVEIRGVPFLWRDLFALLAYAVVTAALAATTLALLIRTAQPASTRLAVRMCLVASANVFLFCSVAMRVATPASLPASLVVYPPGAISFEASLAGVVLLLVGSLAPRHVRSVFGDRP